MAAIKSPESKVKDAAIIFACYAGLFILLPLIQQLVVTIIKMLMMISKELEFGSNTLEPIFAFIANPAIWVTGLILALLTGSASFLLFKRKSMAYTATMIVAPVVLLVIVLGTIYLARYVFALAASLPEVAQGYLDTYILLWLTSIGHYAVPFVFVLYQFHKYKVGAYLKKTNEGKANSLPNL